MKVFPLSLRIFLCAVFVGVRGENLVENCLVQILEKYFQNKSILVVLEYDGYDEANSKGIFVGSDSMPDFGESLLRNLMVMFRWTFQVSYTENYMNWTATKQLNRPYNSLIILDDILVESLDDFAGGLENLKRNPLWNPTARNVIVVRSQTTKSGGQRIALRIMERLWKMSKASNNLVMIVENDEAVIEFYTWFPYRDANCGIVEKAVHLDTFRNFRFERNSNLFPARLNNSLNGCEVVAATDQCIPYVFSHDESGYLEKGVEIEIVNMLAETLNFRLTIMQVTNISLTSINGTPAGVFSLLTDQKIDLVFSCMMLTPQRSLFAQAVRPYLYDSVVWFVPSPTLVTHASDLFFVFHYSVWIAMTVIAVASSFVILFMTTTGKPENQSTVDSFLKVVAMSLSFPANFFTNHSVFRVFVFLFYMYSFHMSIFFQGSLYDHFREPRFSGIYRSVDQAVNAGLFVYLYRSTRNFYNQTNYRLWNRVLQPGRYAFIDDFGEAFREIAAKKNSIALYIYFPGVYMVTIAYRDRNDLPKISWLDSKYATYPVTMYVSPGNPFFSVVQTQIQRLTEAGFVDFWVRKVIDSRGSVSARDLQVLASHERGPLTWKHMNGCFILLVALLSIATVVFVLEIATFFWDFNPRRRRMNKKLKAWIDKSKPGLSQRQSSVVHRYSDLK